MIIKLYAAATTDGVAYVDMPVNGTLVGVHWSASMIAGAGGAGTAQPEVSRAPVNQITTNNPKGVISSIAVQAGAASTGACVNTDHLGLNERVQIGERLYLNNANVANAASTSVSAFLMIS